MPGDTPEMPESVFDAIDGPGRHMTHYDDFTKNWEPRGTVTEVEVENVDIRWIGDEYGYLWVGGDITHGHHDCLFHITAAAARSLRDFLTEQLSGPPTDGLAEWAHDEFIRPD